MAYCKMFEFIKKVFVRATTFFGCSVLNVNALKCVSLNSQECKIRPEIININSKEHFFILIVVK